MDPLDGFDLSGVSFLLRKNQSKGVPNPPGELLIYETLHSFPLESLKNITDAKLNVACRLNLNTERKKKCGCESTGTNLKVRERCNGWRS